MHASLNQIYTITYKVCKGKNLPEHLWIPLAENVRFLEEHQFSGLEAFGFGIRQNDDLEILNIFRNSFRTEFDLKGTSCLLIADIFFDWIVSRILEKKDIVLTLNHAVQPIFLMAAASSRKIRTYNVVLSWFKDGLDRKVFFPSNSKYPYYWENVPHLPKGQSENLINIRCSLGSKFNPLKLSEAKRSPSDFVKRHSFCADHGLEVSDQLWNELSVYAKEALVLATEESRQGAGESEEQDEED